MDSKSDPERSAIAKDRSSVAAATTTVAAPAQSPGARPRLDSLDFLRGLVMVVMVLDHTRDYLAAGGFNPRDLTDPALFLTRWVTHFCAPTFVFLAGISAHLASIRRVHRPALSRFLFSRGVWLIFLELSLIRFAWTFSFRIDLIILQVIWAIGVGLVLLSALIYLPRPWIAAFSIVLIAGHNLLDRISAADLGSAGWLWVLLHQQSVLNPTGKVPVFAIYPLIPWIAVLSAGYCFGPAVQTDGAQSKSWILRLGVGLTALFLVLRAANVYGDPLPWSTQPTALATVLSFLNCSKYPPSLLFLCMTIGPAMLLLSVAGRFKGWLARVFIVFGRVPFFFYLAHIFLVHLMAVVAAVAQGGAVAWLFHGLPPMAKPAGFGFGLPMIYVLWLIAVAILYLPCHWFAQLKQSRRDWWLSYL